MQYHRGFTCKRDITLADPRRKIGCSLGYKYLSWKFLLQICFIHQLHFHANRVKINAFLKIHIFYTPRFYYGKLPITRYFLLVSRKYCPSVNNFFLFLVKTKLVLKSVKVSDFFVAVFMEKTQKKIRYLNHVNRGIGIILYLHCICKTTRLRRWLSFH